MRDSKLSSGYLCQSALRFDPGHFLQKFDMVASIFRIYSSTQGPFKQVKQPKHRS